jgi:hypothetical protein
MGRLPRAIHRSSRRRLGPTGIAVCERRDDWFWVPPDQTDSLLVTVRFDAPSGGQARPFVERREGAEVLDRSDGTHGIESVTIANAPRAGRYFMRVSAPRVVPRAAYELIVELSGL